MVIDAHGHIGSLGARTCEPVQLARYLTAASIDAVLTANLDAASRGDGARNLDEPDSNLATLAAHRAAPRLRPLYWARPGRFDSNLNAFAGALDAEPFAGAFFAPGLNGYQADGGLLAPYFSVLARLHKPAMILTDASEAGRPLRAYRLAQRHPSVAIVMTSIGRDIHIREAFDCALRAARRRDGRLFVCTAHAGRDEIVEAVHGGGEDLLLFGSDAVRGPDHATQVQGTLTELRSALTPAAFRKLTQDNAARLFHLLDQPPGARASDSPRRHNTSQTAAASASAAPPA